MGISTLLHSQLYNKVHPLLYTPCERCYSHLKPIYDKVHLFIYTPFKRCCFPLILVIIHIVFSVMVTAQATTTATAKAAEGADSVAATEVALDVDTTNHTMSTRRST